MIYRHIIHHLYTHIWIRKEVYVNNIWINPLSIQSNFFSLEYLVASLLRDFCFFLQSSFKFSKLSFYISFLYLWSISGLSFCIYDLEYYFMYAIFVQEYLVNLFYSFPLIHDWISWTVLSATKMYTQHHL